MHIAATGCNGNRRTGAPAKSALLKSFHEVQRGQLVWCCRLAPTASLGRLCRDFVELRGLLLEQAHAAAGLSDDAPDAMVLRTLSTSDGLQAMACRRQCTLGDSTVARGCTLECQPQRRCVACMLVGREFQLHAGAVRAHTLNHKLIVRVRALDLLQLFVSCCDLFKAPLKLLP
mmetsp:Transcript_9398/g.31189  ORF Transcript_9398/g.31189 Transcript_9398/m.31189 type:complete len:174 (+) Transcript_9398:158-679(+)